MNIYIIIPAFNEEKTIKKVVSEIKEFNKNIIAINDSSTDLTQIILKKNKIETINNHHNLGYVKSLEKGIYFAIKIKKADYVITYDADNQFYIDDLKRVIDLINNKHPDIILCKRNIKNRLFEKLISLYTKKKYNISDPFCGLKAFNKKIFDNKEPKLEKHYTIGTEIVFESIIKNKIKVIEIPIKIKKRKDKSRFGNKMKGNFLELKAFFNLIRYTRI